MHQYLYEQSMFVVFCQGRTILNRISILFSILEVVIRCHFTTFLSNFANFSHPFSLTFELTRLQYDATQPQWLQFSHEPPAIHSIPSTFKLFWADRYRYTKNKIPEMNPSSFWYLFATYTTWSFLSITDKKNSGKNFQIHPHFPRKTLTSFVSYLFLA